jgi:alpha-beta hydrolase superfamily lysophospholipase
MGTRVAVAVMVLLAASTAAQAQTAEVLTLRGKAQVVRLYGPADGDPVVVSSGDGGWIHLGPDVSSALAGSGYFVVGFDSRAYLESFTTAADSLRQQDVPCDYRVLIERAERRTGKKAILVGVSEGAGLSALAATDPQVKSRVKGVIALGLGDHNELAWRWKDAIIYVTHTVPNEPAFSAISVVHEVSPVPLAIINATHDEFVPPSEVERVFDAAQEPKQLWMIKASDHKFSDNRAELMARIDAAIRWMR